MKMIKRFFSVLFAVILTVGAAALPVSAVTKDITRDVTLTIYALETADGSETAVDSEVTGEKVTISDRKPIADVTFDLYKVADDETSVSVPENVTPITSAPTGKDGSVTITVPAAEQGRYLVTEHSKPDYCKGTTVPFLVDLPKTNQKGDGFIYDVFAYPKQLVTGSAKLVKTFGGTAPENGETAVFTLKGENGFSEEYTSDPTTGLVVFNDLPFGSYSVTETKTTVPYSVSNRVIAFTVSEGGCVVLDGSSAADVGTVVDLGSIDNVIISHPDISKQVSNDGGLTYSDFANIDAYNGGVATWKIDCDIPKDIHRYKLYSVSDVIDDRLIPPQTADVKVQADGQTLPATAYTVKVVGQELTVDVVPSSLEKYEDKVLSVIFDTPIDLTKDNVYGVDILNIAVLTYQNVEGASTDDDPGESTSITSNRVKVWTGRIDGFKHDKDNNGLADAEFTLYLDKDCRQEIAKSVSDKNGNFSFDGLKDGTYYLKETKAPRGYQADTSVMAVKVSRDSGSAVVKVDVLNIPISSLPSTGGAGTIGLSIIGCSIIALGVLFVLMAIRFLRAYRRTQRVPT